jgi:hypothetical protein
VTEIIVFVIMAGAIAAFIYFDQKKINNEPKAILSALREEPCEEVDDQSMLTALATKEKAKTIGKSVADELRQMRLDKSDNYEEILRCEERYNKWRDRLLSELEHIDDDILYGLAAQYIIAMLITADELEEARRIFSTVTHELPREVITEKHGAQLGSSQ